MVEMKLKLSKKMEEKFDKIADAFLQLVQSQVMQTTSSNFAFGRATFAVPVSPLEAPPTEEEKQVVEAWMKEIDPVIEKEAVTMLKGQVRDMMLMGGNIKAVAKALKEKKKPKLVRKKEGRRDPLYIQIGDGVEEPIEEIYLFG
jgi:hypothetical protein